MLPMSSMEDFLITKLKNSSNRHAFRIYMVGLMLSRFIAYVIFRAIFLVYFDEDAQMRSAQMTLTYLSRCFRLIRLRYGGSLGSKIEQFIETGK